MKLRMNKNGKLYRFKPWSSWYELSVPTTTHQATKFYTVKEIPQPEELFASVPGKICERILTEGLMQITEKKVSNLQGGFRTGKCHVDQIFAIRMLVEKYLGKDRK